MPDDMPCDMAMIPCSWFYILTLIAIILTSVPPSEGHSLQVTNSGPAVIGTPITFRATYPSFYESMIYEFRDRNNDSISHEVSSSSFAEFTYTYEKIPEVQKLVMVVTVWQQWLGTKLWRLDTVNNEFHLSRNLIGKLVIDQADTPESAISQNIVSSTSDVNISFLLHDPSQFFKSFDKEYAWTVDGKDVNETRGRRDTASLTLAPAGDHNVSCYVFIKSEKLKMDYNVNLTSVVTSKDPITKLKVDGKFFIPRNAGLDLSISCVTGTGQFSFCKEVKNASASELDNCTEAQISGKADCSFHISWYFRNAGKWNVWVRVSNDVSTVFEKVEINVLDFKIQPSLSFVVIPVISSIMAVFIIVFGIAVHVQQRRRGFTVEVADFDFSARDDSDLLVKTFFERLRESIVTSVKGVTLSSFLPGRRRRNGEHDEPSDSAQGRPFDGGDDEDRNDPDDEGYASRSIHR